MLALMQFLCFKDFECPVCINKELPMPREMVRQGGRSARIQAEVHAATRALLEQIDRAEITVPLEPVA